MTTSAGPVTAPRPSLSGRVQVFCGHGIQKRRSSKQVEYDPVRERVHFCLCCTNLYQSELTQPGKCPECDRPTGVA